MKVKELIEQLRKMPQDLDVMYLWDGEPRTEVGAVYEARDGYVVLSGEYEVGYSTGARPHGAPTCEENPFWSPQKREY
jgi:hypothetical protein